jgi:Heterokaryon incompatibility protein (HET)
MDNQKGDRFKFPCQILTTLTLHVISIGLSIRSLSATLLCSLSGWIAQRDPEVSPKDMTADAVQYSYRDLESDSHIRVVELLPKGSTSPPLLGCRIHHMDLDAPDYEYLGISYAWGDTSMALRKKIHTTEGSDVLITANLHSCLSRLQQQTSSVFLWADAISINQGTDQDALRERSAQVRLMHRIYSEATEVFVELGDFPLDDGILANGLRRLASVQEEQWNEAISSAKDGYGRDRFASDRLEASFKEKQKYNKSLKLLLSTLDVPDYKQEFWLAFERLLERTWFRRIWIVQELSLSKHARFLLGSFSIPEEVFIEGTERALVYQSITKHLDPSYDSRLARIIFEMKYTFGYLTSIAKSIRHGFKSPQLQPDRRRAYKIAIKALFATRDFVQVKERAPFEFSHLDPIGDLQPLSFLALFFSFQFFECSDPRDRVYGLLGLAEDRDASELYVDYDESSQQVSMRLSKHLIRNGFGKWLLYLASHSTSQFPSWAMRVEENDWGIGLLTSLVHTEGFQELGLFRAAGKTEFACTLSRKLDHCLTTRGILLARIDSQTAAFPMRLQDILAKDLDHHFINSLITWGIRVSKWMLEKAARTGLPYPEFKIRCFRTLLADLEYGEDGKIRRIGNSPESISSYQILEAWFHDRITPGQMLQAIFSKQHTQEVLRAVLYMPILKEVLVDRRLGIIVNPGDGQNDCNEETSITSGNPHGPEGWLCQLPREAEVRDHIAILCGCPIPFVLRKDPDSKTYRIVGCCYVDRMMDGEAIERGHWPLQEIVLS